ncbi:MAG: fibronectin type III domain-containing protein, partial [Actinomycetes bacterium]
MQIPALVVRGDSSVVALWATSTGTLQSSYLTSGSTTWTSIGAVSGAAGLGTASGGSPDATYDGINHRTVTVWRVSASSTGNTAGSVKSAALPDGTSSWSSTGTLPQTSTNGGSVPTTVTINPGTGRIVAATMAQSGKVWASSLASGSGSWTALPDIATGGNPGTGPRLGSQPDGTTVVAWRVNGGAVTSAKIGPADSAWSPLPTISLGTGAGVSPWVALNPRSGSMMVSWIDAGAFKTAILPPGGAAWTDTGTPAAAGAQMISAITVNPTSGQVLASWYTTTSGAKAAISLSPPGPPSPGGVPTLTNATTTTETISWLTAQDGGSPITGYKAEIATSASGPWAVDPTGCDALGAVLTCTTSGLVSGGSYYYRLRATNANGDGDYSAIAGSFPTLSAPGISSASITGVAQAGTTLTAAPVGVSGIPTPSPSYQWQIADSAGGPFADIPGATDPTFTPDAAHVGKFARVIITETNGVDPDASATSAPTAAIEAATVAPTISAATISGTAGVGLVLTANAVGVSGVPTPTPNYQWQIADSTGGTFADIPGATDPTFTPDATLIGKFARVIITETNGVDPDASATSAPTAAIEAGTLAPTISAATISGAAGVGLVLTANAVGVTGVPTPTPNYQWQIADSAAGTYIDIPGATNPTYTPVPGDLGKFLRVV